MKAEEKNLERVVLALRRALRALGPGLCVANLMNLRRVLSMIAPGRYSSEPEESVV